MVGRWRISGMELWDEEVLDLVEPAFIKIDPSGTGLLGFIAVSGTADCRLERVDGVDVVEFSWEGDDEGTAVSGRGRASRFLASSMFLIFCPCSFAGTALPGGCSGRRSISVRRSVFSATHLSCSTGLDRRDPEGTIFHAGG